MLVAGFVLAAPVQKTSNPATPPVAAPAAKPQATLAPAWPATECDTLSEDKVTIPAAFQGQPVVVVWSFSRAGGEKTRDWMAQLQAKGIPVWSAAMLESAPRLVRGFIRGGMRKTIPTQLHNHTLLLYQGDKEWRRRLQLNDPELPLVVVLNAKAETIYAKSGLASPELVSEITNTWKAQSRP